MLRRMAIAGAVAAMGVFMLSSPASASARPPERFTLSFTTPGTVDCGTFQDEFTDFLEGKGTAYFDSAGNPIRIVIHWEHHSNDTNSVTGLTLHEHGHYTETIDLLAGTDTLTGNQEIMNRPGTGVVITLPPHQGDVKLTFEWVTAAK